MTTAATGYPLTLDVSGRRVLVVGAGPVGARRALALVEAGARVDVVAPVATAAVREAAAAGRLTWHERPYDAADLTTPARAWLVHTATGTPIDASVAAACEGEAVWCTRADDAAASAAWTPAVARGTAGTPAEGLVVAVTGDRRCGPDPRRSAAVRDAVLAGLESGTLPVRRVRRPAPGTPGTAGEPSRVGRVALVGGGPGDPGLLTVRGRALLAAADVVVTDRLGPRAVLDALGPDVEVVDVGKQPQRHPIPQDRINELLVEHALAGKDVVRLKGGDPFVLGRGGEEALFCAEHGVPVEVVPGVTSAVSVPAAAGIPVTHRGITASFVVASAHEGAREALAALRDAPVSSTLVLLMGVSALRETAESLMAAGRPASTPVALVESGWTAEQRTTVTTLEKAALVAEEEGVRAPAVVVVGEVVALRAQLGDLHRPTPAARPDQTPNTPRVATSRGRKAATRGVSSLRVGTPSPLVLLAHGSPDPRHAAGAEAVAERVRARAGDRPVHLAYLDHHPPSVADVATSLPPGTAGVLAPLLLTAATHVRDDVPEAARALEDVTSAGWAVADALGPDPLLLDACEELLARGGTTPDPATAVVIVLGGSSAREAITAAGDAAGAERTARGWGPWVAAALSGGEPLEDAVRRLRATPGVRRVVVVTYMVADGILRDRMVEQARALGVDVAPGTLGETDALARLLLRRADGATRRADGATVSR